MLRSGFVQEWAKRNSSQRAKPRFCEPYKSKTVVTPGFAWILLSNVRCYAHSYIRVCISSNTGKILKQVQDDSATYVVTLEFAYHLWQDPAGNRTFFSKSKILEKVVKQVQDGSATHIVILGFAWILSSNVRCYAADLYKSERNSSQRAKPRFCELYKSKTVDILSFA